jgi:poly-gamma-glutamate synthesis protein (capsule biosynthesis protein)
VTARRACACVFLAGVLLGCGRRPVPAAGAKAGAAQPARHHTRIVMVGDVLLAETPGRLIAAGVDPFAACAPWLAHAELAVGNLECSVACGGDAEDKEFTFRANPDTTSVLAAHLGAVSLANNHSGDFGPGALLETFAALEAAHVPFFGAGPNLERAHEPLVVDEGGIKLAFLGYDEYRPRWFEAGTTRPGVAWSEDEQVLADIVHAREHGAKLVIPFLHWGWEDDAEPCARQRELARRMLDAGATLVVGAHPHVTQGVELERGTPIVYSLGNFVFDLLDNERQSRAWLLRLDLDDEGVSRWDTVSIRIDERGVPSPHPELASPCGRRGLDQVRACTPVLDAVADGL